MPKFRLPGDEFSHVCRDHTTARIRPNAEGFVDVTDEELAEVLAVLAADPTHPIERVKGKA